MKPGNELANDTVPCVEIDGVEPGRRGPDAPTEATGVEVVVTSYNPDTDGDPDPGEIVWTSVSICDS